MRLLIGGPTASGKSTLAVSLYRWFLLNRSNIPISLHELDVYSDSHGPLLGLKPWSERKKRWQHSEAPPEVVAETIDRFLADSAEIVFGDLPGRVTNPYMLKLMACGTHALFLGKSFDDYLAWSARFAEAGAVLCWNAVSVIDGNPIPDLCPCGPVVIVRDLLRIPNPALPGIAELGRSIADAYLAG